MLHLLFLLWAVHPLSPSFDGAPSSVDTLPGYEYRAPSDEGTGKYYMGREIAPVMGPGGISWLDRSTRPADEHSQAVLALLHLRPEDAVADVGAGSGYYSFQIAPLVSKGKVYAVDIQQEMIDELNRRKAEKKAGNVIVVKSDSTNLHLPASSIDIALLVDVYHELLWPREILSSMSQSLKRNGKLILVEYRAEDPKLPIKRLHKTSVTQITKELNASGFFLQSRNESLPLQHFFVFVKKDQAGN